MSPEMIDALIAVADFANVPKEGRELFIQYAKQAIKVSEEHTILEIDRDAITPKKAKLILKKIAADIEILHATIDQFKIPNLLTKSRRKSARRLRMSSYDLARIFFVNSLRDHNSKLSETIETLAKVREITAAAISKLQENVREGRRSGSTNRAAFDVFAYTLFLAAKTAGGELKISKAVDGLRKGTYLDAIELLRPYLPKSNFFPAVDDLGRTLERIIKGQ
jgi:hypothetical protein